MIVYHMSDTLCLGDTLCLDFKEQAALAEPFVQALARNEDCFFSVYLAAKYNCAVLRKFGLKEWSNHVKWAVEGLFEYVRRTEFPDSCSRLKGNYFFDTLDNARTLYEVDWGQASQEEREKIHLYQVDLKDDRPRKLDMRLYDQGFDGMWERDDFQGALECARRYFSGEHTPEPVWEIVSNASAQAVADLTRLLHE